MEEKKRIEWIDILKGIGIVLVVIGHIQPKGEYAIVIKTIYLFHMPLFFFLSGYMYKKKDDLKRHIKDKCYQLLVPYFSLLALFLPVSIFVFPTYTNLFVSDSVMWDILRYISGRSTTNLITGTLWFLICLFFTQIAYNIICVKFKLRTVHIIVCCMLILSYINYMYFRLFWLPFNAHLILASVPIYHIGHLYKYYQVKERIILLTVCTLIALAGVYYIPDNVYNIVDCFYGVPFFTLFCSIILTLVFKQISINIAKYNIIKYLFIILGKSSIIIMAFHLVFIVIFEKELKFKPFLVISLSTTIPLAFYFIFNHFTLTRALFMGSKDDFRLIRNKIMSIN